MMRVPFFKIRYSENERDELDEAASRVIGSRQFILGEEVEAFEAECATYLGVKHAVGVSSGTDALLASLMALGVGDAYGEDGASPGGVAVPAFTFAATATAVVRAGGLPVFCDAHDEDLTINLTRRESWNVSAIIPVHLFGACACIDFGAVPVIEDAAQAFGSFVGQHARFVCHSFFPTKNLGGFGDGGLVTTNDANDAARLRAIRNHGSRVRYTHEEIGGNFRLDALQAALLRVRLRRLPYALSARRANANLYHECLKNVSGLRLPPVPFYGVPNQFVVRTLRREDLRQYLSFHGIGTEVYYPTPPHLQPCFRYLGYKEGDFPVAEKAAKEVLALPIFPGLRAEEIEYVCAVIRDFF